MLRPTALRCALVVVSLLTLAGCSGLGDDDSGGTTQTLKIGYVTPQTGPLAPFGEADKFVVDQMTAHFRDNPLKIGDTTYSIEIIVKDSQSTAQRAGEVASDLINNDGVNLMLAASTPDTTNPVSDICEANGIPCITTVAPWQPWFFGRGATPTTTYPMDVPLLLGPRGRRGGVPGHVEPAHHQQESWCHLAE